MEDITKEYTNGEISYMSTYGDILSDDESPKQVGRVVHGAHYFTDKLKCSHLSNEKTKEGMKAKHSKN